MVVLGGFDQTVDFDPGPGTASVTKSTLLGLEMFAVRLTPAGSFAWVRTLLGSSAQVAPAAALTTPRALVLGESFSLAGSDFDPGPAVDAKSPGGGASNGFVSLWAL